MPKNNKIHSSNHNQDLLKKVEAEVLAHLSKELNLWNGREVEAEVIVFPLLKKKHNQTEIEVWKGKRVRKIKRIKNRKSKRNKRKRKRKRKRRKEKIQTNGNQEVGAIASRNKRNQRRRRSRRKIRRIGKIQEKEQEIRLMMLFKKEGYTEAELSE